MKRLNEFINNSNSNDVILSFITEAELIKEHGKTIDNIFNKFNRYNNLLVNNNINESLYFNSHKYDDIFFNTEEQLVAQKLLINIVEQYAYHMMIDEGLITESMVNENVFQNIKKFASEKTEQIKTGLSNISKKFKQLYDFLNELVKNGIKSVKQMFWKITDMMIALGCKFEELVNKLKLDKKKALSALLDKIKSLFKRVKSKDPEVTQNVYESYAQELIAEEDTPENNQTDNTNNNDKSEKTDGGKSWGGLIGDAAKTILIQMFAYYAVTLVLPAIITLIGGPIAGAIAECLGKIIWSSGVVFLQARKEYKFHKDGEYAKLSKVKKWAHNIFFWFNICWAAWKAISGVIDMGKIVSALASNNENIIKTILPSDGVQKITTSLNKVWKGLTGENAPGFDKMQEHIDFVEKGFWEEIGKGTETTTDGMSADEIKKAFEEGNFKSSADAVKYFKDKGLITSLDKLKELKDNGNSSIILDGHFSPTKNKWSADLLKAWKDYGGSEKDLRALLSQGHNAVLHGMNKNAGAMAVLNLPNKFLKFCGEHNVSLGHKGAFSILGSESTTEVVKKVLTHLAPIKNSLDVFGGLFPWGSSKHVDDKVEPVPVVVEDGEGFRVRLGSENDKENFVYEIGKGGVKQEKMSEVSSIIKEKNGVLIDKINGYFNEIKKSLKEKLEHTEDEGDKTKFNEHLELIEKTIKEQEITIFYGKKIEIEEKNESHYSLYDYLILEGITNSQVIDNIKQIGDYFLNYRINGTDGLNGQWNKRFKRIFNGDELEENDIKSIALYFQTKIFGQNSNLNYTKIVTLLTVINKLSKTVKDNNNANETKTKNNDIDDSVKFKYNFIVSLLKQDKTIVNDIDKKKLELLNIPLKKSKRDELSEKGKEAEKEAAKQANVNTDDTNGKEAKAELEKQDITIPGDTDNTNNKDTKEQDNDSNNNNDEKEVPVLAWSPIFLIGCDLADATKDGPRKDVFTMKNMYNYYQYLTFDGGLSENGIEKFLGEEIIANGITTTYNISANKPCFEKNGGKFEVNSDEGLDAASERDDFGKFTNNEITEIMNDHAKGKNYLKGNTSGKISKSDKKKIEATQSKIKQTIKDSDKLQKYCQNSKTLKNVIDDNGNINDKELDNVSMAVTQEQAKENTGFWGRVKNFFSSLFGGDNNSDSTPKYDDSEIKELLKEIKEILEELKNKENKNTNESLNLFNKQNYRVSLQDYIYNKTK